MLPIVRPYEYLIVQKLLEGAGTASAKELSHYLNLNISSCSPEAINHAIKYMIKSGFFKIEDGELMFSDIKLGVELEEYIQDLIEYGLGRFEIDFGTADHDEQFHLWGKYKKEQVQQLLLKNPKDIMLGTKIYGDTVYIYVTVVKDESIKAELKYADGYIDNKTFQWETVANIKQSELESIKQSKQTQIFVRKVSNEDGIQLPFTYIGSGKAEYIEGSKKPNGAHLFRIPMNAEAPEDIYFDFKLPEIG